MAIALLKNTRLREVEIGVIKGMLQILLSKDAFKGAGEDGDSEAQRYADNAPKRRTDASKQARQRWSMGEGNFVYLRLDGGMREIIRMRK